MFVDISKLKVYVRPGVTDMRKHAGGLSVLVQEHMELDPLSGSLFIFCNRRRNILKVLYWERNGFALWSKKLEKHRYPWPQDERKVSEITQEQLRWLLDGIDFWNAHSQLFYSQVS